MPLTVELEVEPFRALVGRGMGAFDASLGKAGIAGLARRLRSDEPWDG